MNPIKRKQWILVFLVMAWLIPAARAGLHLPVTEHTLSNGMKVLALEKSESPVVAFALYYRVGSVDEVAGKTGIAHYCEHMMFKSTDNLEGETFARLMGTVGGGHSNANTSFDRTCYHQTVPPDRLELVIRLEADRMAHLNPSRTEAASELEVVKEELRLNYLDNPSGRMRFELYQNAFDVHPYKTITIGHLDDVSSITWEDLMAFQHKFYVPSNAVAVVVGRFETASMLDLMETHFGSLPPGDPVVRRFPTEPEQAGERRFELDMPVQRSMLWAGYKVPEAADPDNLTLRVLTTILSRGGSSPLGKLAQGDDPVAMYAYAWCRESLEPGLLIVNGMTLPGVAPEEMLQQIDAAIAHIRDNGVTEEQLQTAKTQLLAQEIYGLQSCMGIAMRLGEAEMVATWRDAMNLSDRLETVTADAVQTAAQTYLVPDNRTVGIARADADRAATDSGESQNTEPDNE